MSELKKTPSVTFNEAAAVFKHGEPADLASDEKEKVDKSEIIEEVKQELSQSDDNNPDPDPQAQAAELTEKNAENNTVQDESHYHEATDEETTEPQAEESKSKEKQSEKDHNSSLEHKASKALKYLKQKNTDIKAKITKSKSKENIGERVATETRAEHARVHSVGSDQYDDVITANGGNDNDGKPGKEVKEVKETKKEEKSKNVLDPEIEICNKLRHYRECEMALVEKLRITKEQKIKLEKEQERIEATLLQFYEQKVTLRNKLLEFTQDEPATHEPKLDKVENTPHNENGVDNTEG